MMANRQGLRVDMREKSVTVDMPLLLAVHDALEHADAVEMMGASVMWGQAIEARAGGDVQKAIGLAFIAGRVRGARLERGKRK